MAATVAVALLTTNDFAVPGKKVTPGAFAEVSVVGVRVRSYVPALRVLDNIVLILILPVISPVLIVISLWPAVKVCALPYPVMNAGTKEAPVEVALLEYQKERSLAVP